MEGNNKIVLHGDFFSQPVRAVWSFLTINDVSFEFRQLELIKGGHKTKEYIEKVNPAGKIPVMECGPVKFMESHAMLRFIQAEYGKDDHWYPKGDALQRAKID